MTVSLFSSSPSVLLLTLTALSAGSPIRSPESQHRASAPRDIGDNPSLDIQDIVSQFLSTLNLTDLRPQPRPVDAWMDPPEYMLELYNQFARDHTAVPSASIVRSFKNKDSSPYSVTIQGVKIHPLLFNISIPHHEHVAVAELRLFTLVQKAQRRYTGLDCKVSIYKVREDVVWTKEMGKEGKRRDKEEVVDMKDLEEVVTKHIHARDKTWVSFDLTHVATLWRKSPTATHRLEVHIANSGSEDGVTEEAVDVVDIVRRLEESHNAVMIVFSDDQSREHKQDKQELNHMVAHENELTGSMGRNQPALLGHADHHNNHADHDELDTQSLMQLQSNGIYETSPRIRRNARSESCKRASLFVNFKDIGWDSWIIQPEGYEAYRCKGVCNPPMTSEVSPTKHAIVQTLLSAKSPERVSRACCVPTKLEPISLLYHDSGVVTFNHKYEGMVVAECGCR